MQLTQHQRSKRKANEGFGDNRWGTNEDVILPENPKYDNLWLNKLNGQESFSTGNSLNVATFFGNKSGNDSFPKLIDEVDAVEFEDKHLTRSLIEDSLPHINKWECVIDGKLAPKQSPFDKTPRNIRNYRIPLMLKTIGFGQQLNNYKLVPLQLFERLKIIVTLNADAFFVPAQMTEYQYFGKDVFEGKKEHLSSFIPNNSRVSNEYKVTKCTLHTEQYRFSPSIHAKIMQQVSVIF